MAGWRGIWFFPQTKTKPTAKPEILKHGGNGGEKPEETEEILRGIPADQKIWPSAKMLTQRHYFLILRSLWFSPPFPPCFKISGFDLAPSTSAAPAFAKTDALSSPAPPADA